jgi:hypothetical protein
VATKTKKKLSPKQVKYFGSPQQKAALKRSRSQAAKKRTSAKKTTSKKKTSTKKKAPAAQTNWVATIGAGLGGLAVGTAAGYAGHDAIQGMLTNVANDGIPIISGLAGMLGGKTAAQQADANPAVEIPGVATPLPFGTATTQYWNTDMRSMAAQGKVINALGSQVFTGAAAESIKNGATIYTGQTDSSGFPIGIYQQDTPFWAKQAELGTI